VRILIAHSLYRIAGGEDRYVQEQAELLSQRHDVQVVAEPNSELVDGFSIASRMLYSAQKKQSVERILDTFQPNVVHLHNVYPSLGPAVHLAAKERGIPIVMTVHNFRLRCPNGLMFTEGSLCRRCQSGLYLNAATHRCFPTRKQAMAYASVLWIHRFVMRLEDAVSIFVVPSDFMKRRVLSWGIDGGSVRMVRHFVRRPSGADIPPHVGKYGAFVGRLAAGKGLDILLRALRLAGDPSFVVAGDGPLQTDLQLLARRLGLQNTRFAGRQEHDSINDLLAGARYLVVPSLVEETASLSALEALASGCPLLVSDGGALPELVQTGAGLTSRAGDAGDLAEKLLRLMDDDGYCRAASQEALSFASRSLDPERHLTDLELIYERLSGSNAS
jgi:glycosyltransferase involved in cell wall biosynthesis